MLLPFVTNTVLQDNWLSNIYAYNVIVSPARVSVAGGVTTAVKAGKRYVLPPETGNASDRFHLYHIGNIPKHSLGLIGMPDDTWINLEELMKTQDIVVTATLTNGAMVSPRLCWVRKFAIDRNMVFAIKNDPSYDFGTTNIYLGREFDRLLVPTEDGYPILLNNGVRKKATLDNSNIRVGFYTNQAYFNPVKRKTATGIKKLVNNTFLQTTNTTAITNWLTPYRNDASVGWVLAGAYAMTAPGAIANVQTLKGLECSVYTDRSIKYRAFFKFTDLHEYKPADGRTRHLIKLGTVVESLKDVSLFIGVGKDSTFKGVHLDNLLDGVAHHLTDTIIAIDDLNINTVRGAQSLFDGRDDIHIYVVVRDSERGENIGLKADRLDSFNLLSAANQIKCVGDELSIDNPWMGTKLEHSAFNKVRYIPHPKLTPKDVLDVYGYYGLEKTFQPQPVPVKNSTLNGEGVCEFKVGAPFYAYTNISATQKRIDVLAYGSDRRLKRSKEYPSSNDGNITFNTDIPLAYIEYDLVYNTDMTLKGNSKLSGDAFVSERGKNFGWRCFVCGLKADNTPDENWVDAVEGDHYTLVKTTRDVQVKWALDLASRRMTGRLVEGFGGCRYTGRYAELSKRREFIKLDIAKDLDGLKAIEPDLIQIWMDGYILIEGVDYLVVWDSIYIVKPCVDETASIHIRMRGVPVDAKHAKPIEVGYIDRQKIVFGAEYVVLQNKNLQYSIDGLLYRPDEVSFGRDGKAGMNGVINGRPYQIQRRSHVIEHYMGEDSIKARLKDEAFDEQILETFANLDINTGSYIRETTQLALANKYIVISPLLNEIVYRFRITNWMYAKLENGYEEREAEQWMAPYLDLLKGDPSLSDVIDPNFVVIAPCAKPTNLSPKQLEFLTWVNQKYLKNKATLNTFIT